MPFGPTIAELTSGSRLLLGVCGSANPGESVLLVVDDGTYDVVDAMKLAAAELDVRIEVSRIPCPTAHGQEPPQDVADAMLHADLVVAGASWSLAHTEARRRAEACGVRFLSVPGIAPWLLVDESLKADFKGQLAVTESVASALTDVREIRVTSAAGTDLTLSSVGRIGNCCPGFVDREHLLGSPPDIEANVSPLETLSAGQVVVDGSVAHPAIGLLPEPIRLVIVDGEVASVEGTAALVSRFEAILDELGDPRTRIVAELGVGLNPQARLTGHMLTDEGAFGKVHIGLGANSTVGGLNAVPFHLDVIICGASVWADSRPVLSDEEVVIG